MSEWRPSGVDCGLPPMDPAPVPEIELSDPLWEDA